MAVFSSARLAIRWSLAAAPRAALLGEGLWEAAEGPSSQRLLHGQLLPRLFSSDASGFSRPFPPSGSNFAEDPRRHQNFDRRNFVRQEFHGNSQVNFNITDNGGTVSKRIGEERSSNFGGTLPFTASRVFEEYQQQSSQNKRHFVHVLLKRRKSFVTLTDSKGNKKTGASVGSLEELKGRSRRSRYAAEATAEKVGRAARKMGVRSVVMKVKGFSFFKNKKKVILSWREGFRGERVRGESPIMYVHDVTQLPHNGCRLPKKRRI